MRWASATTHDPAGPRRIHSDAGLEGKGENMLGMSADQDFSLSDAVSLAVIEERGIQREIEEAIAFNQHFVVAGLCLLPGG
jgi:predicted nucleic acid-binding protein